ncbi:MAG: SRPBCC domain-containing protein [Deltaproteobacteria bacterium]|nr:SRPBCC domain-containing protein [Deltaproteobacteria bacterium]
MTARSAVHGTFAIERTYDAPPERVFAAWADPDLKMQWFCCSPDWTVIEFDLDFRVGGREVNSGAMGDGVVHAFDGRYFDIVPNERIVYGYDMRLGDARISVSLTTVTFEPHHGGTKMIFTEHGVYLDGHQTPEAREKGTQMGLDNLGPFLERSAKTA